MLTILSSAEFSIAAGFGLFAILALFTLRSEQVSKIEITCFFGAIAIAVICSGQGATLPVVLGVVLAVLAGAYVLDHPRLLRSADGVKITLDQIDPDALLNPVRMGAELSRRLGVNVMSFDIVALDYINDMARQNVFKALTVDDAGRLLILERHRVTDSGTLMPYLRLLDPAACTEGTDCPIRKAAFTLPGFGNADFEGMTARGDDLYLLVSDDRIDVAQRSVFALLRVTVD